MNQNPLLMKAEERRAKMEQEMNKKPIMTTLFVLAFVMLFTHLYFIGIIMLIALAIQVMKDAKGAQQSEKRLWKSQEENKNANQEHVKRQSDFEAELINRQDYDTNIWMTEEEQLKQLNTLRDAGILSKEEYRERKARIREYNHK